MKKNQRRLGGLHKEICEICGGNKSLHYHHITPRTDLRCTNEWGNICVVCANCHSEIHDGVIEIIGPYPASTPSGRILVYKRDGVSNVPGIEEPYYRSKPKAMKVYYNGEEDRS